MAASGCAAAITVTPYNSTTGVLALSGSSSLADYQACLRLVTYNNTDQDPSSAPRLIRWTDLRWRRPRQFAVGGHHPYRHTGQ